MSVADEPEWVARANPVHAPLVEVGFVLSDSFYFGPENHFTDKQWQTLREPLYQPPVARHGNYVLTAAVSKSAEELVKYYTDVLRLLKKHSKPWERHQYYFWLRPLILATKEFEVRFPWHDTWEETERLLAALEASGDGEIFSDMDQGWEVSIVARGERLFIRQGDLDTGEEQVCVSCDRVALGQQVPTLRRRCLGILTRLREALGVDCWSRR